MNFSASLNAEKLSLPLHGLRGIAVLYVVLSHLGNNGLFLFPIGHNSIGKIGVWIFFSLSSFLLTTRLYEVLKEKTSRGTSLLVYFIHRIFRIYPVFFAVILVHYFIGDFSIIDVYKHLILVIGWGELWAIPVEFQYYFLLPIICLSALYIKRKILNAIFIFIVICALIYSINFPESVTAGDINVLFKITPFLFGSALSIFMQDYTASKCIDLTSKKLVAIELIGVIGILSMTFLFREAALERLPNRLFPWISIGISISTICLIYSGLQNGLLSRLLSTKGLVFIGEISFSIYLIHMFVIRYVLTISNLPTVIQAWMSLIVSIVFAFISFRIIERPGIHAGKIIGRTLKSTIKC